MKTGLEQFAEPGNAESRARERRVRWFVAGAVLIAMAAIIFMSVQKGLFQRTTQLHFFADSAKGMVPGMAVKLNGFKVGTLGKLVMDADGRVSMVLRVSDEYVHLIHKDARARWAKEDLIGESVIEILSGSENAPVVENNAVIGFERARDIGEEIGRLANQLQPILADVKNITAYVDNPDGDLKKTVRELKRASTALADAGEDVSDTTRRNKQQIQSAITNASNALATLNTELPRLIGRMDTSLRHVEGATADVHAITGKLAEDLPPAVSEGRETLQDTHDVVNAVKGSWPVRNLLPPQEERSLPLDSHVPNNP
ncbi:MlaD family protein [Candidatus Ferrigenium straubiae]|jgi:phospholipid/cholesterol/gamma-HCH transport system substrate-binding protein|uniref:MlaD family protein n=1 Tax=Candidatus Ferrigenium straubiae TaxID=2919506 RepID=UPI003F4AB3C9